MADIFEKDREFKEAIGAFIIAFSELEYGLVFLCERTEFDLRKKQETKMKYLGFTFEQKVKHISNFTEEYLKELKPIWDKLKVEIGLLNRERRFLVHGFMQYFLPKETITTYIKESGELKIKKQTVKEIKSYTNRLHHLISGKNGVNGEFHTLFTLTRINNWNLMVNDDNKITYSVNSKIISDWKGKAK